MKHTPSERVLYNYLYGRSRRRRRSSTWAEAYGKSNVNCVYTGADTSAGKTTGLKANEREKNWKRMDFLVQNAIRFLPGSEAVRYNSQDLRFPCNNATRSRIHMAILTIFVHFVSALGIVSYQSECREKIRISTTFADITNVVRYSIDSKWWCLACRLTHSFAAIALFLAMKEIGNRLYRFLGRQDIWLAGLFYYADS